MTYYMHKKYGSIVSDTREPSEIRENWKKVYVVDPENEAQMNAIGDLVGMHYKDVQELVAKLMEEPKPVDALIHIPVSVGTQTMETLCGIKLPVGRPVNITGRCEYCKSKALDQREWRAN